MDAFVLLLLTLVVIKVVRRIGRFIAHRGAAHNRSGGGEAQRTELSFDEAYELARVWLDEQFREIISRFPGREEKYLLVKRYVHKLADGYFNKNPHRRQVEWIGVTFARAVRQSIRPLGPTDTWAFRSLLARMKKGGAGSDEEPDSPRSTRKQRIEPQVA